MKEDYFGVGGTNPYCCTVSALSGASFALCLLTGDLCLDAGWKILRFSFPHRFKDVDFLVPVVVVLSDFRSNLSFTVRLFTL